MVLVEGENADGVTVDEDNFDVACDDDAATLSAADQVISAILGTREGATEAGHLLTSTGITWTDQVEAAALRKALAARKIEKVMLVSAFLAAAALAQTVGNATGNARTALLFLEPDIATLAVVDSADGSIADVHKRPLSRVDAIAELAGMLAGLDALETRPEGVFVVGSGVDIAAIKPRLEAVTSLPVSAPEEPETALARGAALASASAPLFASSTAALAYAQDPGTGVIDPYAVAPGYLAVPDVPRGTELGEDDLAYSAVPDEEAEASTVAQDLPADDHVDAGPPRRPLVLVGSTLAVVFVTAALALEVSLALGIRPSVALLPRPLQSLIVPTQQAPAPPPVPETVSAPQVNHLTAPVVAPPPIHAPIPAPPSAAPAAPAPDRPPAPVIAPPVPVVVPVPIPAAPPAPMPAVPLRAPAPVAPVHVPASQPPVRLPAPQPPVVQPRPPVHLQVPQPPVAQPTPPVQLPALHPPVHLPAPQPPVVQPTPPVHVPVPQPPVSVPAQPVPQPPVQLPTPPDLVHLPAPAAPPAPVVPAPEAPSLPSLPVPRAPAVPAMPAPEPAPVIPQLPQIIAPPAQGPSLNPFGGGAGPGLGGFGGDHGGGGGLGGIGGFGGGGHGLGGFGGGLGGFGGGFGHR
jgi:hypothetical protein